MLCSVPASKSSSSWLDRLRSNKGFPTGDSLDLDHFLTRNPDSCSEFPATNVSLSAQSTRPNSDRVENRLESSSNRDGQGEAFFGVMDDVLSELFFMGQSDESAKLSGKKIPRKQRKPRICVSWSTNSNSNTDATANVTEEKSSECARKDGNALEKAGSLNSDNSSLVGSKKGLLGNVDGGEGEEVEEEEEDMREMKGYSKSEVTVIDTSCGVWKSEKVVYRRKNVWKVREKKAKVRSFGRHKRKGDDGDGIHKKKAKVSGLENQCMPPKSIQGQNSQNETRKYVCEDTPDILNNKGVEFGKDMPDNRSKVIKKGLSLNRSPIKLKKGDSSVVLIKSIPSDNKNGGKLHRKCLKDSQKQYKP